MSTAKKKSAKAATVIETPKFFYAKKGKKTEQVTVASIRTKFKEDDGMPVGEFNQLISDVINDRPTVHPEGVKTSHVSWTAKMRERIQGLWDAHLDIEVEIKDAKAKAEAEVAAAIAKRGETLELATAKGYAGRELIVDQTVSNLCKLVGKKFQVGSTGLTVSNGATINEADLANLIAQLASGAEAVQGMNATFQWALGDACILAETALGPDASSQLIDQVIELSGRQKNTIQDAVRVARAFPVEQRHKELSFTHYQELKNYKDNLKPKALEKIIEATLVGENPREIKTSDGQVIKQAIPLSCKKMRALLQEASGKTPTPRPAKDLSSTDGVKTTTPEATQSTEAKEPDPLYIIVTTDGAVYQSDTMTAETVDNDGVAVVIDTAIMMTLYTKDGKIVEGKSLKALPDEFKGAAAPKPAAKKAASKKSATPPPALPGPEDEEDGDIPV